MKDGAHLEQLDADDGEEEDEEQSDNDNVADRLHRDDQTLDHLLQTLRPVDGPERPEHTEDTENLEEADAAPAEDGDEGDADDDDVETVEGRSGEGSLVEEEPISDQLERALDGEDGGEEVVPVSQGLKRIHETSNVQGRSSLYLQY